MSVCMFLKVFGDLCLCYSAVSALPTLFVHEMNLLWAALICGLGAGVAGLLVEQGKGQYRFWALLFPVSTLLLAGSSIEVLMLAPAIVYTAVLVIRENMVLEYYEVRSFFLKTLVFWAIFLAVVGMLFGFEHQSHQATMTFDFQSALGYGLLYGLCGILLLRRLRLGVDSRGTQSANTFQLLLMLVATAALVAAVIVVERVFHEDLMVLIANVLPVLFAAPFVFLGAILGVFIQLFALLPNFRQLEEQTQQGSGAWADAVTLPEDATEILEQVPQEAAFPWWLAILVIGALVVLLLYMLRLLRAHDGGQGSRETVGTVAPERREKKKPSRSNRAKVRRLYRSYLKLVRKKGQKLNTNQTSADILEKHPADTNADAAARLREIYLKARYDEHSTVTDRDVTRAKEAVQQAAN